MERIKEGEFDLNIPTENALLDTLNCGGDGIRYLKSMWEDMIEALWDGSIPTPSFRWGKPIDMFEEFYEKRISKSDFEYFINTEFNLSEQYFWSNIVRGNVDDRHKPLFDWCLRRYDRDAEDSARDKYEMEHDL